MEQGDIEIINERYNLSQLKYKTKTNILNSEEKGMGMKSLKVKIET